MLCVRHFRQQERCTLAPIFPPCSQYCLADSSLQTLCFPCVHLWRSSNGCSHPAGLPCGLFLWVNCCLCSLKDHHNCRLCWNTFDTKSPLLESLQLMHSDSSSHQEHQLWKQSSSLCSLWTPHLSCPRLDAPSREEQVCEMQIFTRNFKVSLWARKINAWHTCCHLPVSYDLYRLMPLASQ